MAKSWSDLSPSYRKRLESWARRHGYTPEQIRQNPNLRKQARGHARTEGHGFSVQRITRPLGRERIPALQVGKELKSLSDYRGGALPTNADIARMIQQIPTQFVAMAVQIESYSEPGTLEWVSFVHEKNYILDILRTTSNPSEAFQAIYNPIYPVDRIFVWQAWEVEE